MRKLATVRIISAIENIEGADNIVKATIDGWECVVKKNEFEVGDKCIYIEVDSIVPAIEYFDFMEKRRYRVKTIKLRKQISQGLVIPYKDLLKIVSQLNIKEKIGNFKVGHDLTELLKIIKHDPQAKKENLELIQNKSKNPIHKYLLRYKWYKNLHKKEKGWPKWIQKTDEDRIQNRPRTIDRLAEKEVSVTEKLDGQSASYSLRIYKFLGILPKHKFYVCSRNICIRKENNSNYWKIARKYDIENKLKKLGNITIQGEITGPGIQKNKYNLNDHKFHVYNMHNLDSDIHYGYSAIQAACISLDLKAVPLIFLGKLKDYATNIKEIVKQSEGNSVYVKRQREGIVVRENICETKKRPESFKVINPKFLLGLKEDE